MKKYIFLLSVALFGIIGCDKIEPEDFLIDGSGNGVVDTTTFVKKILIEDFTGHTCQNCPEASDEIHTLQNISAYQGKVYAVAIHSGFFSTTNATFTTDFTTEEGDDIHDFFELSSYPKGMVNRIGYPNALLDYAEWGNAIANLISQEPELAIKLSVENNTIVVEAKKLQEINDELKLVVMITENNIIDKQLAEGQGIIEDYEHNHVLRSTLNGAFGQSVELNTTNFESFSFNYQIDSEWIEANCNVLAYIYDDNTKEIIQVEEIHLIP